MDQQGDAGQPNRRIEIRHRFTVNTLYEGNHPDLRTAVEHAVRTGEGNAQDKYREYAKLVNEDAARRASNHQRRVHEETRIFPRWRAYDRYDLERMFEPPGGRLPHRPQDREALSSAD